jgi:DNA polymerase (family 10)
MSKVATRYSLAQATEWARSAETLVGIHAPLVAVAGSIRRRRDDVGDVDLVVLDDTAQNPWQRSAINRDLAGVLGYEQTKDGDKIASFTHPTRCPLDLYYATDDTWGITLLVRTGSAGHNMFLVEHGRKQLPARRLTVSRGIVDTAGNVVASRTEEECFAALGLAFVPPWERKSPEYDAMVRADETP